MKIIDAHLHFTQNEYFDRIAKVSGGENSFAYVKSEFERLGIVMGIAMGNAAPERAPLSPSLLNLERELDVKNYNYPEYSAFCAGINPNILTGRITQKILDEYDEVMKSPRCVGLKAYVGYDKRYIYDDAYKPFFELAAARKMPVVIHTGDVANSMGLLKYAHPLTVDEAASEFPDTTFVIAHYGNPWILDATQVASKCANVFIDLSGMIAGRVDRDTFIREQSGFVSYVNMWMKYLGAPEKFMYGSDWPLVNMEGYIDVLKEVVPHEWHDCFFFENALCVFPKLNPLISRP